MLTKTLQTLIERAERKGQATKRVREGAIMGSYNPMWNPVDVKETPMIDQWRVTIHHASTDYDWKHVSVDHYGTCIAEIVVDNGNARLVNYYGESNSDRDALNGLCSYYGIDEGFRYRPSIDKFERVGA